MRAGNPFAALTRTRVPQRATVKLSVVAEKNPARRKVIGYLFFGVLTSPQESTEADADNSAAPPTPEVA